MSPLDAESQIKRWTSCIEGGSEWATSLSLPLRNPFVPTDFNIRCSDSDVVVVPVIKKPQLIQRITTMKEDEEEEDLAVTEDSVTVTLDGITLSTEAKTETETGSKPETKENEMNAESQIVEEEVEEEEEEEQEEDAGGQLPPPVGKVNYPQFAPTVCCSSTRCPSRSFSHNL